MKKLGLIVLLVFSITIFVHKQESLGAPYYQGKMITILVGFSPGGGYDRLSRMLAKHLPKHIPGKPNIIVQNMPGASSILATNYLYNVVKPDGLTIGTFERGLPLVQLLKVEGVKFDLRKFAWVGSTAVEATILALRSDLPFKNFNDVLQSKSPIILGRTGPADNTAQLAFLLQEFAGLKLTLISYPASPEIMLAIERKELDGRGGSYSALKPDIERGLVRPFLRSRVSEQVGRPYVAPPGTPEPVMKILRDAFASVVNDPALKEEVNRFRMRIEYLPPDGCLKVINFVMNQPDSMVKEFSKYIKF